MIEELNRILQGESIYDQQRFPSSGLSGEVTSFIEQTPRGAELTRFNRLLLEQTYPAAIIPLETGDKVVPDDTEPGHEADQVRFAFQRGYTALNHSTRLGEKTVSWYRGPLVPLYLSSQPITSPLPWPTPLCAIARLTA